MSYFRSLFGPSQKEIWGQIARDIGGDYIDGGFWKRDAIRYRHGHWEILLDSYTDSSDDSSTTYTRMRAPFINRDGLYFKIYRQGFFSSIGKAFGMQDIIIGDPFFDDQFIIQGNNENQIKALLADTALRGLIQQQPRIHFEVRDNEGVFRQKFPATVDELYFRRVGIIKETRLLKGLFDLFTLTLQRLVEIDSAYEDDPSVQL